MSIAVIGTGKVGGSLAGAFARAGLDVVIGSRNPDAAGDGAPVAAEPDASLARRGRRAAPRSPRRRG
ncbi:NAD(P)-binding domain-containing protein [Kitasatospora atroaurantiaca]|uniref:NAD(P)-binding domain-containing protein n=1 Tax=Kitasatospora atroaurantiaca TaxID=285545 RepID=UPI0011A46D1C|nr:NAD(P)-binding domain-containing protein [Kitasatospora atroaurantiaca]